MKYFKEENILAFYGKNDFMSNHYPSKFSLDGVVFLHVEQGMMFLKAKLFGDDEMAIKILNTYNPSRCKRLGRRVKNFNENVWGEHKYDIVKKCIKAKFSQNINLKNKLFRTGDSTIVEASPYDGIWGVKLDECDPNIKHQNKWKGENLLGKIIMEVRKELSENVWEGS